MSAGQPHDIAGELDRGALHPQANTKKRNASLADIVNRFDLALDAAFPKAAWHQNPVVPRQQLRRALALDLFTLNSPDPHLALVMNARMIERLINRFVRVLVLGIFADDRHADLILGISEHVQNPPP